MVTIRQRQRQQQLTTVASNEKASTVSLTVTNLTANVPKHHINTIQCHSGSCRQQIKTIFQLSCGNIKFVLMLVLIVVIAIAFIDAATPEKVVTSSDDAHARFLSKPLPNFGGDTQQFIARLLQHYQPGKVNRSTRQDHQQQQQHPVDGNIFAQLNSFIQARQRNASDLAGNIVFKYYDT